MRARKPVDMHVTSCSHSGYLKNHRQVVEMMLESVKKAAERMPIKFIKNK